jgi:hypothetical protein
MITNLKLASSSIDFITMTADSQSCKEQRKSSFYKNRLPFDTTLSMWLRQPLSRFTHALFRSFWRGLLGSFFTLGNICHMHSGAPTIASIELSMRLANVDSISSGGSVMRRKFVAHRMFSSIVALWPLPTTCGRVEN